MWTSPALNSTKRQQPALLAIRLPFVSTAPAARTRRCSYLGHNLLDSHTSVQAVRRRQPPHRVACAIMYHAPNYMPPQKRKDQRTGSKHTRLQRTLGRAGGAGGVGHRRGGPRPRRRVRPRRPPAPPLHLFQRRQPHVAPLLRGARQRHALAAPHHLQRWRCPTLIQCLAASAATRTTVKDMHGMHGFKRLEPFCQTPR